MKRVALLLVVLSFFASSFRFPFLPLTHAKDLSLSVKTDPEKVVINDTNLTLFFSTNLDALLSVYLTINKRKILIQENQTTKAGKERKIKIPITYPILGDFEIEVSAETLDSSSKTNFTKAFIFGKKNKGNEKIKGRVFRCSDENKTGIEGAKIEIISGPTIGSTYAEDDGYFLLDELPKGAYKLRISHGCSAQNTEKIVFVDQDTPFAEVCLNIYGIPDFDFWLNKDLP
jgi:hypothetical protein